MNTREQDISIAHTKTCDWIFHETQFKNWNNGVNLDVYHGVLWIKGHPGTGKSTLMKHIWSYCNTNPDDFTLASYFFNARGSSLEKSPIGMLRSLTYQLLDPDPLLQEHFLPLYIDKKKKHGSKFEWHVGELKPFCLSAIKTQNRAPIVILVDALDECNEPDVRAVISFLESLSINARTSHQPLRICHSSRHYPLITMAKFDEFVLERHRGHEEDITRFVKANIRYMDEGIIGELLEKADNVFMWVVLVIEILNRAYDEVRVRAMRKKLNEVPPDLENLFSSLLEKYEAEIERQETVLMFQWVLFANKELCPEELYFAVLAGTRPEELGVWNEVEESQEIIRRHFITKSKGLVEVQPYKRRVQFIHQSVKDFLLRNRRLQSLDASIVTDTDPFRTRP